MRLIDADKMKSVADLYYQELGELSLVEKNTVRAEFKLSDVFRFIDEAPTVEQPDDTLDIDEKRLIGEAVNYLLGADLQEENGWSKEDVDTLHRLCMKFYGEDYN